MLTLTVETIVMALPISMLGPLRMKKREKIGLAFIFALVLIDVAFDILRVVFTVSSALSRFPDQNVLWNNLDALIAVLVCTLPCYRGLLSRSSPRPLTDTTYFAFGSSRLANLFNSTSSGQKSSMKSSTVVELSNIHEQAGRRSHRSSDV